MSAIVKVISIPNISQIREDTLSVIRSVNFGDLMCTDDYSK